MDKDQIRKIEEEAFSYIKQFLIELDVDFVFVRNERPFREDYDYSPAIGILLFEDLKLMYSIFFKDIECQKIKIYYIDQLNKDSKFKHYKHIDNFIKGLNRKITKSFIQERLRAVRSLNGIQKFDL